MFEEQFGVTDVFKFLLNVCGSEFQAGLESGSQHVLACDAVCPALVSVKQIIQFYEIGKMVKHTNVSLVDDYVFALLQTTNSTLHIHLSSQVKHQSKVAISKTLFCVEGSLKFSNPLIESLLTIKTCQNSGRPENTDLNELYK